MAKQEKPKVAASETEPRQPAVGPPEGFDDVGAPDVDGWWKPEPGLVITGKLVGRLRINQDGAKRDVVLVQVDQETKAQPPKSDESTMFEPGAIIGLGLRHKLRGLLLYVKHGGRIWVRAERQTKLNRNQTMWQFTCKAKGRKAQPDPIDVNVDNIDGDSGGGYDNDDIPF